MMKMMNCDEFRNSCGDFPEGGMPDDMREHAAHCRGCAEYYATVRSLVPREAVSAPASLKGRILAEAVSGRKKRFRHRKEGAWYAVAAALLASVVLAVTTVAGPGRAVAAVSLLDGSVARMSEVRNMVMRVRVRTTPYEGFGFIDTNADFVGHELTVLFGEPFCWRLDKGGRTAVSDGAARYMWLSGTGYGVRSENGASFEEWFSVLLDPRLVLMKEKEAAERHEGVRYAVRRGDGAIRMTVRAKARGDFDNDYMLNSSIEESDTRREYTFDEATGLLKTLKVYVLHGREKTLVMDVESVEYDTRIDERAVVALPDGCVWRDVGSRTGTDGRILSGMPEEAAAFLFGAFGRYDSDGASEVLAELYDPEDLFSVYGGAELAGTGETFRSGLYPGVFLPVDIVLRDGTERRLVLALRNDNPAGIWTVDGGL